MRTLPKDLYSSYVQRWTDERSTGPIFCHQESLKQTEIPACSGVIGASVVG